MRRLLAVSALVVVALSQGALASAEESGNMIVMPAQGTIDTPVDVVTSGVCSRGVTFVVAVRGEGIDPATAGNAVGNTDLKILEPALYPGHHAVPLARTLREFFVSNGVSTPVGSYDLIFACRNRLDMANLQTFTATVRIDKSGAYRALGAAATPLDEFLSPSPASISSDPAEQGDAADPSGQSSDAAPRSQKQSGSASADASGKPGESGQSAEPSQPGEPGQPTVGGDPALVDGVTDVVEASSTSPAQQDNTWRYALIGLGAVLLAGAAYMGWKSRAR